MKLFFSYFATIFCMKRAAIAKAKSCLRLPNLSHKYCSCKISHNLNILLRKELWKCQKEHNVKVIMFRWKKVTEIRDIKTSKLIRGHTIRCENVENDSMTLSMWQYQTCKNHKESKCFAILYHNGYFHKGTAFVWQTLPNLASKHYVYQPHQISYLEQLLKTHWAKRMTFSIFNVPKAKPPKNTPKDHIWSNWTLFVYKEAFSILPSWLLTWKSWGFLICRHQPHYSDRAEGSEHLQSTNRAHSCQSIILNVLRNVNSCWVLSRCLLLFVCIVHRLY